MSSLANVLARHPALRASALDMERALALLL